jgi:7,8-dihydroneopterin aldolase/epimerase/oxygenase
MNDKILFKGMRFYAYHGVHTEEKKLGQPYEVDVAVHMDLRTAGRTDRLEDTLDYGEVYQMVDRLMQEQAYNLVETVAEQIAARILQTFSRVQEVNVRVIKPTPPIPGHYEHVAVDIHRTSGEYVPAGGDDQDDPYEQSGKKDQDGVGA